jgi:hypothetical protein
MESSIASQLKPGQRVRVVQQIAARNYSWKTEVSGAVVAYEQRQTGSWFAHSRNDKLWLDRLVIRKDDGEITTLILDDYSHVEIVEPPAAPAAAPTAAAPAAPAMAAEPAAGAG